MPIVYGVVVTFNPNHCYLKDLISSIARQCSKIVIVDNSEGKLSCTKSVLETMRGGVVELISLGQNIGLAAALNLGITRAMQEGAEFILLSDQDSLPTENMVAQLLAAYQTLVQSGENVGAVGPSFTDIRTGTTFPFQVCRPENIFYKRKFTTQDEPYIEALGLITSGTLIPAEVINNVGLMIEEFFIDKVDHEWCHRARDQGYKVYGIGNAHLYHRLGERALRVWYLGWKNEVGHSPSRVYYQVRNFFAICRLGYVDWRWKIRNGWYTLGVLYAHVFFGKEKLAALRMGLKGIWHGLIGKMGGLANINAD
ncbi:MAG: glycosyltransferase family 2 protein [Mucilaginibacter sp.]